LLVGEKGFWSKAKGMNTTSLSKTFLRIVRGFVTSQRIARSNT
jgi:hypothetical protein